MENKKILVVENEIPIALHIGEALSSRGGYTAQIAANGAEALEMISADMPDLVIMDILLDDQMDGIEASEIIKARYDIPVIYITASTDYSHLKRAIETEPYGYIIKPIDELELSCAVQLTLQKHESEKKIGESEERYRSLFEGASDHVFLVNKDLQYFAVNPSALQAGGFQLEDIKDKGPHEVFHEDGEFYLAKYRKVLQTGKPDRFERELRLSDGFHWFSVILSPIRDKKGDVVGLTGISRDITERKNAEAMLRRGEQEIRIIADSVPGLFSYLDAEGRYRFVSKRYEEWFGVSREETIGKHYREVLGENTYEIIRDHVNAALSGKLVRYENELPYSNGGTKWVIAEYVPDLDEQGNVDGFFALVIDITERKRAEELAIAQRDLGLALGEMHGLDEALGLCLETAIRISGMDSGGIYLLDEPSGAFDLVIHQGLSNYFVSSASHYAPDSPNVQLIMAGRPVYSEHQQLSVPLKTFEMRENLRAIAILPVRHEDQMTACLNVASHAVDVVPNWSRIALEAIAAQIGSTLASKRAEEAKRESEMREREYIQNLEFLSRTAFELLEYPADGNHYEFIGGKLNEIIKNAVIIINSYDESSNTLCCRDIRGLGGLTEKVTALLGKSLVGMVVPLTIDEAWERLHTGRIMDGPAGLHDLSFGKIPKRTARAIEKLLGIDHIYAIGFVSEGKLFGTAIFVLLGGADRISWNPVETFIHQAAIALQRRQAVYALSESERKYRDLVENISDVIYTLDGKGIITYISPVVKRLYGYDPDDIIGKHFTDLVYPEDVELIVEGFERSLQDIHLPNEYRLITRSGEVRWFRVSERTIHEGDMPAGVRGILTDITEKKLAEEKLRESEERFRDIVENAEAGYFFIDTEGYYQSVNKAWLRMYGYSSAEEVIGKHFSITQVETDLEEAFQLGEQVLRGEPLNTNEFTRRCKDGSVGYHSFASRPVVREGKVVGIEGFMTDITERKRMEQRQCESEEKARVLLNAPIGAVLLIDSDGNILDANETVLRRTNRTMDEVIGMSVSDLVPEEVALSRRAHIQQVIDSAKPARFVDFHDGIWNDIMLYPIFDADGKVDKIAAFGYDITEKKTLEKEILNISEKERRRIGQELHDGLGQLLTGIAYITEVLKDKLAEKGYSEVSDVKKISALIEDAIEQTRGLARGLYPVISEPSGIITALESMALRVERIFGISCRVERSGKIRISDNAVATNLFFIAQEAVNNAIKHGKAKKIRLCLNTGKSKITIAIHDDGTGYTQEKKEDAGMGLRIMRYRAEQIGAEFSGVPGENGGFTVTVALKA